MTRRVRAAAVSLVACALVVTPVAAQQRGAAPVAVREPDVPEKEGKVLVARRVTGGPPVIDGVLNDSSWARADSVYELTQWEPDNMAPASERTVVRVLYDDKYVYVGVNAYDRDARSITTGLGRRDKHPPSDAFSVGFDTRHDHQTAYVFLVNASGVRSDYFYADDERSDVDHNAVWEARTTVSASGWGAEFRIPFSQMRFAIPPAAQMVWGFDVRRNLHRRGEQSQWVGRPRGRRGQVSRFAHLVFEGAPAPPRRVELIPFVLARATDLRSAPAKREMEGGLDARLGLGSAATLAATVLPDFGQVEADPAVLNLSVFETFFPERRPFFLEEAEVFRPPYGLFRLFHSRRIGRRPGFLRVPSGETVVERPEQTTLLGAAKITGKTRGWTYGALNAVTAAEHALVERGTGDSIERARRLIEPLTSYAVTRLQRNVGRTSNVGWIGTAVVREREDDAFATGIDYNLRWGNNRWYWDGHWAGTRAPLNGRLATGFGGVTNAGYSAKHYGVFAHADHFGRNFRVTDLGFLATRTNRTAVNGGFNLHQPDPWGPFRNVSTFVASGRDWNADGLVFSRWTNVGVNGRFHNFWRWNVTGGYSPQVLDDLDTRGGPPIVLPASRFYFVFVGSDTRKRWRADLYANGSRDAEGGSNRGTELEVTWNPAPRLQTSTTVGYRRNRPVAQWIRNFDATGDGVVDYVYGALDSRVIDIRIRSTFAVHSDLTFEFYAQPFVAVGDYSDFRRLARPSSFEFEPVALSFNPDFNRKSLLGNAVVRWEYRPGSTLFLVWNAVGSDASRPGEFDLRRDLADAFSVDRDNIFMVKANYWLSW